jgi:hypothetical protein
VTLPSTLIPPLLVLVFIGDSVICALAGVSPRFGPRFVSRVEPNRWSGSRFRITSDYKNRFEPERTFSFPG